MDYSPHSTREQKVRSVDLTFKGTITEEEYEAMTENAHWRPCPHCGDTFNVAKGFDGPVVAGKGGRYCDTRCVEAKERELAPMIKPQPKGTKIDGWDV